MAKTRNTVVQEVPQKRTKKSAGINSITPALKKISGILDVVNQRESITSSEKFELQVAGMYLTALKDSVTALTQKNVSATQVQTVATSNDVDDDEFEDE